MAATKIRPIVGVNNNEQPAPATVMTCAGAPDFKAAQGTLVMRTDAAATNTRLYINTDGDTTWTVFAAAA